MSAHSQQCPNTSTKECFAIFTPKKDEIRKLFDYREGEKALHSAAPLGAQSGYVG